MKKILVIAFSFIFAAGFANKQFKSNKSSMPQVSAIAQPEQHDDSAMINMRLFVPGVFVGWLGGVLDVKLSDRISLGPIVKYFAYGDDEGGSVGLNMNIALDNHIFSDGWLINPYIQYYKADYDQANSQKVTSTVVGSNLMYQWVWPNGLNIQLGGGFMYSSEELPLTIGNSKVTGNLDFTLGYMA